MWDYWCELATSAGSPVPYVGSQVVIGLLTVLLVVMAWTAWGLIRPGESLLPILPACAIVFVLGIATAALCG